VPPVQKPNIPMSRAFAATPTRRPPCAAARVNARGARAFTIVELLVVIGILGVLTSILLPSVGRARQQAYTVQCASNLRTFAQAWLMYADANQRVSCPARMPGKGSQTPVFYLGDGTQYRPRWYELLGAVNKIYPCRNPKDIQDDSWTIDNSLFLCPAVPNWVNSRNYPYGYNYQFLGNARPKPDGKWINWPVKSDRIRADQTVMAADCMGTAAGKPKASRQGYYVEGSHDPYAMGNKGWALDPPRLTGTSDYADPERRNPQDRSGPDPRHNGRLNVGFCDGHVELATPRDLGYAVAPDGSYPVSGGGADNRLFSGTGHDDDPPPVR
jgi:prepilin-type processing-associated H-X9-DG protein/prepilin-type N-terminal cleavage/methylation domain-containing protein